MLTLILLELAFSVSLRKLALLNNKKKKKEKRNFFARLLWEKNSWKGFMSPFSYSLGLPLTKAKKFAHAKNPSESAFSVVLYAFVFARPWNSRTPSSHIALCLMGLNCHCPVNRGACICVLLQTHRSLWLIALSSGGLVIVHYLKPF